MAQNYYLTRRNLQHRLTRLILKILFCEARVSKELYNSSSKYFSKCSSAFWNYAVCAHKGCMCPCVYHFQLAGASPSNCGPEKPHTQSVGSGYDGTLQPSQWVPIATSQTPSNAQGKSNGKRSRWAAESGTFETVSQTLAGTRNTPHLVSCLFSAELLFSVFFYNKYLFAAERNGNPFSRYLCKSFCYVLELLCELIAYRVAVHGKLLQRMLTSSHIVMCWSIAAVS